MPGRKRSHGGGPVWVRVAKDGVLPLARDPIRRVLEGPPGRFRRRWDHFALRFELRGASGRWRRGHGDEHLLLGSPEEPTCQR